MKIEDLWTEIEADYAWRSDELRFFHNQLIKLESKTDQDQFRRANILLLYSHFEGFCKFAFLLYISSINAEKIDCAQATISIKASTLSSVFSALRNPDTKCKIFKRDLPDDSKLHRFSRDLEFLERTRDFDNLKVNIPDEIIDLVSNLKPIVLKKTLFKLGLNYQLFSKYDGTIYKLLEFRNKIAHGEMKSGINKSDFESIRNDIFQVMTEVKSNIMEALTKKLYLKNQQLTSA